MTDTLQAFRTVTDEFHFVLGDIDGYGWCDYDAETGDLVSAGLDRAADGTQASFDVLAAAIDSMSDGEFLALCVNAPKEN